MPGKDCANDTNQGSAPSSAMGRLCDPGKFRNLSVPQTLQLGTERSHPHMAGLLRELQEQCPWGAQALWCLINFQLLLLLSSSGSLALENTGPFGEGTVPNRRSCKRLWRGLPGDMKENQNMQSAFLIVNPSSVQPLPVALGQSLTFSKHLCPRLPSGIQNPYPTNPSL